MDQSGCPRGIRLVVQTLLLTTAAGAATSVSAQTQPIASGYPQIAAPVQLGSPYVAGSNRITKGPDGNVWFTFTNNSVGYIGQLNPQTQVTTVFGPLDGSPLLIAPGPPGDYFSIWFVETVTINGVQTAELGRISTVQTNPNNPTGCTTTPAPCITLGWPAAPGAPIPYTNLPISGNPPGSPPAPTAMISSPNSAGSAADGGNQPVPDTSPQDQDNGIYIADKNNPVLWRANILQMNPTMSSQISWSSTLGTTYNTFGVTWGPDNYLWCTEYVSTEGGTAGYLERIPFPSSSTNVTSQQISLTTFSLPSSTTAIPNTFDAMAPGPDGLSIWFSQNGGTAIDSILTSYASSDTSYTISPQYTTPPNTALNDMTLGPDFALWFTQTGASATSLGRLSLAAGAATATYTPEPLNNSSFLTPYGITVGPNNNDLWFTDSSSPVLGDVVVIPRLTIGAPATLPNAVIGTSYSTPLLVTGGNAPYNYSALSSTAPSWLSISAASLNGTVAGPPATNPPDSFAETVTDTTPAGAPSFPNFVQTATQTFSLTVASVLAVTPMTLPSGIAGAAYSAQLQATGGAGSYTWSQSGLPAGLSLNPSSGLISGQLSVSSTFSVTVTDSETPNPQTSAAQSFTIAVAPVLSVVASSLPSGLAGSAYSTQLQATGGTPPYQNWTRVSGSLPPGLSLGSGGVISGPLTASTVTTTYTFSVMVSDSGIPGQTAQTSSPQSFSIVVTGVQPTPTFTVDFTTSQPAPGSPITSASVTSSAAFTGTLTVALNPIPSGFPSDNNGDAGFGKGFGSKPDSVTLAVPSGTTTVSFPTPLDPGTVAGTVTATLSVQGQSATSSATVTVEPQAPIIEANSVQIIDVTSTGFSVELVATSTTLDLKTANFTFTPASGAQISGNSTFTADVSSLLPAWFATASNYQYGGAFSLSIPFTISGPASAIGSVSVTLTNSVGTSSAVSGTQ